MPTILSPLWPAYLYLCRGLEPPVTPLLGLPQSHILPLARVVLMGTAGGFSSSH